MSNDSFELQFLSNDRFELKSMEGGTTRYRDTFQVTNFTLRFVRDNDGKVGGIDFHSPVFRNLRFTRLSDATSGR